MPSYVEKKIVSILVKKRMRHFYSLTLVSAAVIYQSARVHAADDATSSFTPLPRSSSSRSGPRADKTLPVPNPIPDKMQLLLSRHPGLAIEDFVIFENETLKVRRRPNGPIHDYTVVKGDTLSNIAQDQMRESEDAPVFTSGACLDELIDLNPQIISQSLMAKHSKKVLRDLASPAGLAKTPNAETELHESHDDKVTAFLKRHPSLTLQDLTVVDGQELQIGKDPQAPTHTYVVKSGDTLSQIAQREIGNPVFVPGGSLDVLADLNPQLGQRSPAQILANSLTHKLVEPQRIPASTTLAVEPSPSPSAIEEAHEFPATAVQDLPVAAPAPIPSPIVTPITEATVMVPVASKIAPSPTPNLAPDAPALVEKPGPWVPTPSTSQAPQKELTSHLVGGLGVDVSASNWVLSATNLSNGTSATVASQMSPAVTPSWTQFWGDSLKTKYYFAWKRNVVAQAPNSGLSTSALDTTAFGFDTECGTAAGWAFVFSVKDAQEIFFEGVDSVTTKLTAYSEIEGGVELKKTLYHYEGGSFTVDAGLNALAPTKTPEFNTNWGTEWHVGLQTESNFRTFDLVGGVLYDSKSQKTTLINQNFQEVILNFGFKIHLYGKW